MGVPIPEGLKPVRIVTFVLAVQTANQGVKGQAAGAPDLWAVGMTFVAIRPSQTSAGTSNTGNVAFGSEGIADQVLVPGATGAVDVPEGYAFYLGDLTIAGANVGDSICCMAFIPAGAPFLL